MQSLSQVSEEETKMTNALLWVIAIELFIVIVILLLWLEKEEVGDYGQ